MSYAIVFLFGVIVGAGVVLVVGRYKQHLSRIEGKIPPVAEIPLPPPPVKKRRTMWDNPLDHE